MPEHSRPCLLFYCQHSLGIGHLTRSFALVEALTPHFRVVFLNGGRLPDGVRVPAGMERIDLPPLGMDDGHTVISRGSQQDVQAVWAERKALIGAAVLQHQPAVVLVELFPFGRKKFAGEILPLIRAARRQGSGPAMVVCSLRDILVNARPDQQDHDDRARWLTDRYFDQVLVHADAAFARLEDSFKPRQPLNTPVRYTGFVVPAREREAGVARGDHILVSAGGGIVGDELFRTALAARALMASPPPMRIVAGPFLPEPHWAALQTEAARQPGVTVVRHVPDMVDEMRRARASISQCGYNTALDLVTAQVPALVVPYHTRTENEQQDRAARLAALGALLNHGTAALTPEGLRKSLEDVLAFTPQASALRVDGAVASARAVLQQLAMHQPPVRAVA
jgi:predicted glycosyltransferase